jgi:hypothetical protein
MRTWAACLFVCAVASPAPAQTRVRLVVDVESWLDSTPFNASQEFIARLAEAHIEVVDDLDAPMVRISYEELAGPAAYWPKLVPTTNIHLRIHVERSNGGGEKSHNVLQRLAPPTSNFPSAAELRLRAIDDFRRDQSFRLLGHHVGAFLGNELSFRPLLSSERPDWLYARMLLRDVLWSPSNDDLFVRAFRALPVQLSEPSATMAVEYLSRNLSAIQAASSGSPLVAPILAMLLLEDFGDASATQLLSELVSHPLFGSAARKALIAVEARTQPTRQ